MTSVGQKYELMEECHDYRTGTGIIYKEQGILMNISKTKDNYNKEKRPKYFNCNKYGHMTKEC